MPEVFMPRLSDTMTEGVITQWLKGEGDAVHPGDVLAEVETDKATMELEAYDEGVLTRIVVPAGSTVPIGETIAVIGDGSGASAPAATPAPVPETAQPSAPPPEPATTTTQPAAADQPTTQPVRTSPLARSIARQHGIDLATIRGSGPGGRVVRADVEAAVAAQESAQESAQKSAQKSAQESRPARPEPSVSKVPERAVSGPSDDVEEIALTAVRRVTARRLSESATVPHFDLTGVIDAEPLLAFRAQINEQLAVGKVSVTDLLVRACAVSLRAYPQLNASWGEDKILRHKRVHVGLAVALDDGLIVPVLRDADRKTVSEISAEARELAARARAGRLTPDEFTGGTFTISNLGMYGIDHFTAVINPPEAAILAVGAATPQPVVRDGELVAGVTMTLTLSIDHRVSDGATGALFLRDLRELLEHPLRIVA